MGVDLNSRIVELEEEVVKLRKDLEAAKLCGIPTEMDRKLYPHPLPKMMNLWNWLPTFANRTDVTVLEIGSREVANKSRVRETLPLAKYIGFDVHEGKNVDLVGDAHRLSDYLDHDSVDVIVSFAVFEHLAMPWVVAEEFSKVLKVGGVACTFTHFSFSEHELPWHFFQFNNRGLEVLFNRHLGFDIVESGMGMPMVGRFAIDNSPRDVGKPIKNLYCSSYAIAKKVQSGRVGFGWRSALSEVYGRTEYPRNTGLSRDAV